MNNKVILITGASSGIGAATAYAFAKAGGRVAISYRENKAGAEDVASKIKELGAEARIYQADLSTDAEAAKLVESVVKDFGTLDILVNNAGRYVPGDDWESPADIWVKSLEQNLISVLSMSKYAARHFLEKKSGQIINLSSRYSYSGVPDAIAYSTSKAGVANAAQAYAKLLAPFGRANAVSPGAARAGYWLKADPEELQEFLDETGNYRLVEPEEVANLILFLVSDEAAHINGQNVLIESNFDLKKFKSESLK